MRVWVVRKQTEWDTVHSQSCAQCPSRSSRHRSWNVDNLLVSSLLDFVSRHSLWHFQEMLFHLRPSRSQMRRNAKSAPAVQDFLPRPHGSIQLRHATLGLSLLPACTRGHVALRLGPLPRVSSLVISFLLPGIFQEFWVSTLAISVFSTFTTWTIRS